MRYRMRHKLRIAYRRKVHQPRAVRVSALYFGSHVKRQSRLAYSAWSAECQQSGPLQLAANISHLLDAPNKTRELNRQRALHLAIEARVASRLWRMLAT